MVARFEPAEDMADILTSPAVVDETRRAAEAVADEIRARAPVDTGTYRDSIHVVRDQNAETRTRFYAQSDDWKANIIENRDRVMGTAVDVVQ